MNDPVVKQKHLDLQKRFEIELSKLQDHQNRSVTNTNATIIIPVAVIFQKFLSSCYKFGNHLK